MLDLTRAQVEADLRELAITRGDNIGVNDDNDSNVCVYAVDGKPSCIVGVIIHKHDPELFEVVAREHNIRTVEQLVMRGLIADNAAATLLNSVQGYQDLKMTWAEAVQRAGVEF
jgi:hypothetical protein